MIPVRGSSTLTAVVAAVVLSSCASSGAQELNGRGASSSVSSQGAIRADVGLATLADLALQTELLFAQQQYELFRTTPPPDVVYESNWRDRDLMDDERSAGAVMARSRMIVRARQRNFTGGTGDTWSVELSIESLVRRDGEDEFQPAPPSEQFKRRAREMAEAFKLKLREGIRRGR